jgi:soluble lytic murein transglycosylase
MSSRLALFAVLWTVGRAASAQECPTTDRAVLLRDDPVRLRPCDKSPQPVDWVWAAHAAAAVGDTADAAALYRKASRAPSLVAIRTALLMQAARSEVVAGQVRQAVTTVRTLRATRRWLKAELAGARADILLAASDYAGASAAAREALKQSHASLDAEWLVLARASRARRDAKTFAEALRALETEYPDSPATASAERLAGPKFERPRLSAADESKRWSRWTSHGGASGVARECAAQVDTLAKNEDPFSSLALLECGRALSTTHQSAAERTLQIAAGRASTRAAALLVLAHRAARASDPAPVDALCAELQTAHATAELGECLFLAAFVRFQAGQRAEADSAFEKLVEALPDHARAVDAAWFAAFDALHTPRAKDAFDHLVTLAHTPAERARALYWRGRVVAEANPADAKRDWTEVVTLDPFGYYGWLASVRLAPPGRFGAEGTCTPKDAPAATRPPPTAQLARLLLDTGFARYASLEMAEVNPARSPDAQAWVEFLARTDDWRQVLDLGLAQGARAATWPVPAERRWPVEAAYPLAFSHALREAKSDVDPCLVLSVMRRESRFDPDATSPAEAVGLLQLLPKTAAPLARELELSEPRSDQLHDPVLNVRLGVQYIHHLLERFHSPLLAAAGYNAGPSNVAAWMRTNAGMPIDEWVEHIPFRETRGYVKAVGAAYATYWLIYGGERPPLDWGPIGPAGDGIDY